MEKIVTIEIETSGTRLTQEQLEKFNNTYPEVSPLKFKTQKDFPPPSASYDEGYKEGDEEHNTRVSQTAFKYYENTVNKEIPQDYSSRLITVGINTFLEQYPLMRFTVRKVIDTPNIVNNKVNLISHIKQINEATEKLIDASDLLQTFNDKVEVHIGGSLLLTVNRVKVLEDLCTESLQEELDEGWRILSVCVQSDQRRPDYVLGKYEPS